MSTSSPSSVTPWRPLIVAHRGCWFFDLPENSIEAFRRARDFGFPSECDVWASADGEPVVMHDETLDRTSTGRGRVGAYRAAELQQFRLRVARDRLFSSPPLLRDVRDVVSLVEIKPPRAGELVREVMQIMKGRPWLLQSFDPTIVRYVRAIWPNQPVALLVDDLHALEMAIDEGWPAYLNHELLSDRTVGRLRDAGLSVGAWTVNGEESVQRILPWRPDVIISDQPHVARQLLLRSGIEPATAADEWLPGRDNGARIR